MKDSLNITKEQAIELGRSGWWKNKTSKEIVSFQLFQDKLCMDFGDFHKAIEEVFQRPVFTHEFANTKDLIKEFLGDKNPPTLIDILNMIPEAKTITLVTK